MQHILVVLGSPNSHAGELGILAKSRLDLCLEIYKEGMLIICTGGWGERFNTTEIAHAVHARNYLLQKGIPKYAFLPEALSGNSVDDAVKTKKVIAGMTDISLTIITSDFHVERVRLIFGKVLQNYFCDFIGAKANLSTETLNNHIRHEQQAIAAIRQNGLYYDEQ